MWKVWTASGVCPAQRNAAVRQGTTHSLRPAPRPWIVVSAWVELCRNPSLAAEVAESAMAARSSRLMSKVLTHRQRPSLELALERHIGVHAAPRPASCIEMPPDVFDVGQSQFEQKGPVA